MGQMIRKIMMAPTRRKKKNKIKFWEKMIDPVLDLMRLTDLQTSAGDEQWVVDYVMWKSLGKYI